MEPSTTPAAAAFDAIVGSRARRVRGSTVPVSSLTSADRDAAYELLATYYDRTDRERFDQDMDEKQQVVLLRDADDGRLGGFCTIHVSTHRPAGGGRPVTVLFTGDTVVDRAYWGQKVLHTQISRLIFRERLRRPLRPFYWLLISKGYKTYKIVLRASPRTIPRHDRQGPPAHRRLLDEVARARFGDRFDERSGIVRGDGHDHVRDGVSAISDDLVACDADVAYFLERNPGHVDGDELVCLAPLAYRDLLSTVLRSWRIRRGRTRRSA